MLELKWNKAEESYNDFCSRVILNFKEYGFDDVNQVVPKLLNVDMKDNNRRAMYVFRNIQQAVEEGYADKFASATDVVEIPKSEELNSFYKSEELVEVEDKEFLLKSNQQLRKQVQSYQDKLRLLRAEHRSEFRKGNSISELLDGLTELIPKFEREPFSNVGKIITEKVGIIHLSDCHISKTVNLPINKFNLEIARERLLKYIDVCIDTFRKNNISECIVVFSGDVLNLDSHGMVMTNEFKRSESLLKAFDLLSEIFEIVLNSNINVKTCSILGNESRLYPDQYMSNVDSEAKENLDYVVYQMLKRRFSNSVEFLNEGDSLEYLLQVNGHDIVVFHGHNLKHNNLNQEIDKIKIRYSKVTGKYPKYCLFGHIHESLITNNYARSGSIVGEDYYSTNNLNIPHSSVTQNLYLVDKEKITGMIIDCR